MRIQLLIMLVSIFFLLSNCRNSEQKEEFPIKIQPQKSELTASARAIYAVDEQVAWIGNSKGKFARTIDGGTNWTVGTVDSKADTLDFRDLYATDAQTAIIMSAGNGQSSRIYKTTNGGKTWKLSMLNYNEEVFFNGMAFWDERNGILVSDPVGGKLQLFTTQNAGETWALLPPNNLPAVSEGEYGFAGSGTNIAVIPKSGTVWVATGGTVARILISRNRGQTWSKQATPMASGKSSTGIFSVAFRDFQNGVAVGGDYDDPLATNGNAMFSSDGGKTWQLIENQISMGYKSCVQHLTGTTYLATGTSGTTYSMDDGHTWQAVNRTAYHAISIAKGGKVGWMVGSAGKIAKIVMTEKE